MSYSFQTWAQGQNTCPWQRNGDSAYIKWQGNFEMYIGHFQAQDQDDHDPLEYTSYCRLGFGQQWRQAILKNAFNHPASQENNQEPDVRILAKFEIINQYTDRTLGRGSNRSTHPFGIYTLALFGSLQLLVLRTPRALCNASTSSFQKQHTIILWPQVKSQD